MHKSFGKAASFVVCGCDYSAPEGNPQVSPVNLFGVGLNIQNKNALFKPSEGLHVKRLKASIRPALSNLYVCSVCFSHQFAQMFCMLRRMLRLI